MLHACVQTSMGWDEKFLGGNLTWLRWIVNENPRFIPVVHSHGPTHMFVLKSALLNHIREKKFKREQNTVSSGARFEPPAAHCPGSIGSLTSPRSCWTRKGRHNLILHSSHAGGSRDPSLHTMDDETLYLCRFGFAGTWSNLSCSRARTSWILKGVADLSVHWIIFSRFFYAIYPAEITRSRWEAQ